MATAAKHEVPEYKPENEAFFRMMWNMCRWVTIPGAKAIDSSMRNFDNLAGAFEILEYLSKTGFLPPYASNSLGNDLYAIRSRLEEAWKRDQENDDDRIINELRVRIMRSIENLRMLSTVRGYR